MQSGESAVEFARRFCTDPAMIPRGLTNLFFEHFPVLFGTRPMALNELAIESASRQGFSGAWIILASPRASPSPASPCTCSRSAAGSPPIRSAPTWSSPRCFRKPATSSAAAVACTTSPCARTASVIGLTGLCAWFLAVTPPGRLRTIWMALAAGVVLVTTIPTVRLLVEYVRHEPENPKRMIVQHLDARGIKYAFGDYWRAYLITFMTNERIIVAADDFQRIREYSDIVKAHKDEAVRIAREFCPEADLRCRVSGSVLTSGSRKRPAEPTVAPQPAIPPKPPVFK